MDVTSTSWLLPFVAGATGGSIASIATCPLEVMKTRLQTQTSRQHVAREFSIPHPTARHVFQHIVSSEGVVGFWRGITPSLMGVIPARAIFFGTYNLFQTQAHRHTVSGSHVNFACASMAGGLVATVTSPLWVLKTRLQLLPATSVTSVSVMAHHMYRTEGVRAFYRGLSASYWGVTEGAFQLMLYEKMKEAYHEHYPPSNLAYFSMAAFAKLWAAAATYPHEVVRTRLRDQRHPNERKYYGMVQSLRLIAIEEGRRGLYGGLVPHLARVVPNAAIMYFVVEKMTDRSCMHQD